MGCLRVDLTTHETQTACVWLLLSIVILCKMERQ